MFNKVTFLGFLLLVTASTLFSMEDVPESPLFSQSFYKSNFQKMSDSCHRKCQKEFFDNCYDTCWKDTLNQFNGFMLLEVTAYCTGKSSNVNSFEYIQDNEEYQQIMEKRYARLMQGADYQKVQNCVAKQALVESSQLKKLFERERQATEAFKKKHPVLHAKNKIMACIKSLGKRCW